jgi:hypothetical protein
MFRLRFFINGMHGEAQGPGIVTHWKPMARWTIKTRTGFYTCKVHCASHDAVLSMVAEGGIPPLRYKPYTPQP